jgi:hypothetical protein
VVLLKLHGALISNMQYWKLTKYWNKSFFAEVVVVIIQMESGLLLKLKWLDMDLN